MLKHFKLDKTDKVFLFLITILHLIYFVLAIFYKQIYNLDSPEYLQQAINIKEHGSLYAYYLNLPIDIDYYTLRPPIYGIFIMLIKLIWSNDFFVLFFQNIISISTFLGLYSLLKQNGFYKKAAYLIFSSLILFPAQLIVVNSIWSDVVFQAFVFWSFYFLLQYIKTKHLNKLLLYNIFLVLALFTKPALVYFWFPNIIFSVYLFIQNKNLRILIYSTILPICIVLWCYFNYTLTGYFHFTSIKTNTLITYTTKQMNTETFGEEYAVKFIKDLRSEASRFETYKESTEFLNQECMKVIKDDFLHFVKNHIKGSLNLLLDPGRNHLVTFFNIVQEEEISFFKEYNHKGVKGVFEYFKKINKLVFISMILIFIWNILLIIGAIFFVFNKMIDIKIRIAFAMFIIYFFALAGSLGCARIKLAIFPLLVFSLLFLQFPFRKIKN